ncbi:MAG: phage baseplate assembly protein V [Mucispirillum sp.]|nr:phage baseplate assembly protein V [Mucispirillum sp.]
MKSQELLNIIKYGTVTEIKADTAQVKVAFKESGDVVSYYMPVLQSFAGKNNAYIMPSVDDTVVCLISPRGEAGVVVGSIYTGMNKPLISDENKYNITFEDESSIEYNKKENLLKADIKGSAEIIIDKSITITITEDKEISAKNIKITAESEINIECKTANIKADSEANIEAGTVNLKGSKVNVGENAARGILHEGLIDWLSTHTHTGNMGSPTSPPVAPLISASCVSSTCKVSS